MLWGRLMLDPRDVQVVNGGWSVVELTLLFCKISSQNKYEDPIYFNFFFRHPATIAYKEILLVRSTGFLCLSQRTFCMSLQR